MGNYPPSDVVVRAPMIVIFSTDASITRKGFNATYSVVEGKFESVLNIQKEHQISLICSRVSVVIREKIYFGVSRSIHNLRTFYIFSMFFFSDIPPCVNVTCENGGTCVNDGLTKYDFHCECPADWSGYLCESKCTNTCFYIPNVSLFN